MKSTYAHHAALALVAAAATDDAASAANEAIAALPWGPCGAFHVTDRAIGWDGARKKTLWRQGKPVAAVVYGRGLTPRRAELPAPRPVGPSQAEQRADAARTRALLRRLPIAAQAALWRAPWGGDGLLTGGGWGEVEEGYVHPAMPGWVYRNGQEGGSLRSPEAVWHCAGRAIAEVCGPAARIEAAAQAVLALRRQFGDTSRL